MTWGGTIDIESFSSASSKHAVDPLDGIRDSSNQQETANIASDSTNRGNFLVSYYNL